MLKTLGVVEARPAGSGERGKVARKLGTQSLLEWIVRRATESQRLEGVIVLAAAGEEAESLSRLVPPDVPVILRDDPDALGRFARGLEGFSADAVVRIRDDSPFFDPALIDRLISTAEEHPHCDYISYCSRGGQPGILSTVGVFAEWFRVDALRRANRKAREAKDREDVSRFMYSHPEVFNLRYIPCPDALDRDDLRLRVDVEEDWELAQTLFDALGPESLEWQRITRYLDHQPGLRERMAELNRGG